jgi:hypothetical protein
MTPQGLAHAVPDADADDATVIRLSRHEPEQFTELFRRHAPHIQRYVVRRLGADAADDIVADFGTIEELLSNDILPPSLNAELYQALGDIPTIAVKTHITDVDGRAGVAFVLPETSQSANLEIILDASDYSYLAQAAWEPSNGSPNSAIPFTETAVLKTTLVSGPGSIQADPAPPSPAELTVGRAATARLGNQKAGLGDIPDPSQWIYRRLGTNSGTREVWARADDTEQAAYVNGTLVTCARSANCARGTKWLMTAGPAFTLVDPPTRAGPFLPNDPQALLDKLNTYRSGCPDTAGYCNAVGLIANLFGGYADVGLSSLTWYFSLADVPGVTVRKITDAAGRADVELSFPFTSGVTGILFAASTYQFAGYVQNGAPTLLLQQANVAGPGVRP